MKPYGQYAEAYLDAGFFPIPARGKRTIKNSHHGRGKPLVTLDEARKWSRLHPSANIAARLPRDIIGIDVDAYGSKPGEDTLIALEADLGALPATVVSTSRFDGVSGIRLFRLPEQYWAVVWPGKAGPGVDIIWHGNRYVIAWPSIHPDTGDTYLWYDQADDGTLEPIDDLPDLSVVPNLPKDWLDHFAKVGQDDDQADVSDTADWINQHGAGDMCPQMVANVDRALLTMPDNAHDTARDGTLAIAKDCGDGHLGAAKAMAMLYSAFMDEMDARTGARRAGARSEWRRHFDGAVRRGAALWEDGVEDPCAEVGDTGEFRPIRGANNVIWAGDVTRTKVRWLQRPVLPFGALVVIDGDPGQGKSTICVGMVANAVNGMDILPFGEHCGRAIKCGIIGAEDDIESVVIGRLEAAGYVPEEHGRMIGFLKLKRKRGRIEQLLFPDGIERVRSFIAANGLELVIIDPITSFLGENVKSHVDASVRMALGPLGEVARDTGACIVLVRHLNKNGQLQAMYRGGGSIAFSAIARSGLITGVLPDSEGSRFGLAQVKCSYAPKMNVTLSYSVEGWDEDTEIPLIAWHGEASLSADDLASPRNKPGPQAEARNECSDAIRELMDEQDPWDSDEIYKVIRKEGGWSKTTINRARKEAGVRSYAVFAEDGRIERWEWTMNVRKIRIIRGMTEQEGED